MAKGGVVGGNAQSEESEFALLPVAARSPRPIVPATRPRWSLHGLTPGTVRFTEHACSPIDYRDGGYEEPNPGLPRSHEPIRRVAASRSVRALERDTGQHFQTEEWVVQSWSKYGHSSMVDLHLSVK